MVEKTFLPQRLFITFSLLITGISPFLQWLNASAPILYGITIERSGFELIPEIGFFAVAFLIIGTLAVWFYRYTVTVGVIVLIMGAWMFLEGLSVYSNLQSRVELSTSSVFISIGTGYYLLMVGAILTMIGGLSLLISARKLSAQPLPPPPPPQ
jgi:hypothetical protein